MKLTDKYLNRSILLEESATPLIYKATIWFSFFLLLVFFIWLIFAKVDELSFATGEIIATGHNIKIQHPEGGKLIEILVKNGDIVSENQILAKLDCEIALINKEENQKKLALIQEKKDLLEQQIHIAQDLTEKKLHSKMSLLSLMAELTDVKMKILDLQEVIKKAETSIELSTLRAPFAGQVHGFEYRNPGEVISAGKVIMEIIPSKQKPLAEIKINAKDIGLIKTGMKATIKVATYDFTKFGSLDGNVSELSVSSYFDENRMPYYKGIIALNKNYLGTINNPYPVLPGMTIDAEITTGQKTILQYLLKPIYLSLQKSFYER